MSEPAVLHLPPRYLEQVRAILRRHLPDAEVLAYGSRVRGDHHDASDLDLAAKLPAEAKRDFGVLAATRQAFADSDLPIIVQVIDWDAIPQSFRDEILAACVLVQAGHG